MPGTVTEICVSESTVYVFAFSDGQQSNGSK